jgi:hypothetical protein
MTRAGSPPGIVYFECHLAAAISHRDCDKTNYLAVIRRRPPDAISSHVGNHKNFSGT